MSRRLVSAASETDELAPTLRLPRVSPSALRLLDRVVWRDATIAWLAQRVCFIVVAYVGILLLKAPADSAQPYPWTRLLQGVFGWDVNLYADIAHNGYVYPWSSAFYPMLPALERALLWLTGGNAALAGLLITNLAAFIAFGLLRLLVERELGREVARRTLLYLICFPPAFFLVVPYTEALFLLFSVASFLALRQKRWLLAGVFAALAELTRPLGILLAAPMVVEYVLERHRVAGGWRSIRVGARTELARLVAGLALPAIALGGFLLSVRVSSPFTAEQAGGWERKLTLPGVGFARTGKALLQAGFSPNYLQVHILLDVGFTLLFIALTVALWRRLPPAYLAYAWATLVLILMTPAVNWFALGSNMRFMLVVFPLFMLLGVWGKNHWVDRLILFISLPLLALFILTFLNLGWVA